MRRCFLCSTTKPRLLKTVLGVRIYECPHCDLAFTDDKKRFSKKELYRKDGVYDIDDYEARERQQAAKFEKVVSVLAKYVTRARILDVGAGHGLFASILSSHGYTPGVVEPYLTLRYIKDMDVSRYRMSFKAFLSTKRPTFDVVSFMDVLEHFEEPDDVVASLKKILKPGGRVIVLLPNYKSLMAQICRNWAWWMVEDHTYHFSRKSLLKLLRKNDYTIEYVDTFEDMSDFRQNLDGNYSDIDSMLIRKAIKLVTMYPFLALYWCFRRFVWKFKRGGLLLVVARYAPQ